jgi:hypothetical protein
MERVDLQRARNRVGVTRFMEGSMKTFNDDDVRNRAFALWAAAGKPPGKIDQFWYRAEKQLEAERLVSEEAPLASADFVVPQPGVETGGRH